MKIEDKAYFDRRIEVETWKSPKGTTLIAGLNQGSSGLFQPFITATYSDGGQQLMTGNTPKFKTEGGARKWLSAEITRLKTPNARQGLKAKFDKEWESSGYTATDFFILLQGAMKSYEGQHDYEYRNKIIGHAKTLMQHPDFKVNGQSTHALAKKAFTLVKFKYARQGSKAKFAKEYILWALPKGETDRLHERPIAEGLYTPAQVDEVKRKATAAGWHSFRVAALMGFDDMTNAFKGKGIKKASSRTGFKTNFEHNLTRKISLQESNSPTQVYKITEELYNKAALLKNKSLGYFELRTLIEKALATGEAVKMSRTGSKTKFANRGAFAEASSSPVLGSLLEKKVMPEGGWRAVETDGGALVIAFEDGDIAGNFARRAAENGYSATAPMAMAGRFWNVKVQNENKQ
jgi:hypothetical protein